MRYNRQAVFRSAAQPIDVVTVQIPPAPPGGMVLRTELAGVCGTDAHRLDGDLPVAEPVTFGHEGIGIVEELGPGVTTDWAGQPLTVGDRVYWFPPAGCRRCYYCTVEEDIATCENFSWPPPAAQPNAAAFQEFATLAPTVAVYRVPDGTPPEAVIAFGCAMPTALGGFHRLGRIRPGSTIVVQGCGPVGLASTLLAALSPVRQVITIGAGEARLAAARRLGATTTLSLDDTSPEERRDAVHELTGGRGANIVIESAGVLAAFDEGLEMLAKNGTYLVQGLYSGTGTVTLDPFRLNNRAWRIIGSLGGRASDIHATVELASRLHEQLDLPSLVTHRFGLNELPAAIDSMRTGRAIKAVVVP